VGTFDSPCHRIGAESNNGRWLNFWKLDTRTRGAMVTSTPACPSIPVLFPPRAYLGSRLRQGGLERKRPLSFTFHNYAETRTPYAGPLSNLIDVLIADGETTQNIVRAGPPLGLAVCGLWSLISDHPLPNPCALRWHNNTAVLCPPLSPLSVLSYSSEGSNKRK